MGSTKFHDDLRFVLIRLSKMPHEPVFILPRLSPILYKFTDFGGDGGDYRKSYGCQPVHRADRDQFEDVCEGRDDYKQGEQYDHREGANGQPGVFH
jgi:hypothetical protein